MMMGQNWYQSLHLQLNLKLEIRMEAILVIVLTIFDTYHINCLPFDELYSTYFIVFLSTHQYYGPLS